MRVLAFNSEEISFRTGKGCTRPPGITPSGSADDGRAFSAIVVAFVCAEKGDCPGDVQTTASDLAKYARQVGRQVLVVPFVHLSSRPAPPEAALHLIGQVVESLDEMGVLEGRLGFGSHKALILRWATLAHEGSVVFRDSRFSQKKEIEHA